MKSLLPIACALTALSAAFVHSAGAQGAGGGASATAGQNRNPAGLTSATSRETNPSVRNKTEKNAKPEEKKAPWVTPAPGNLDGLEVKGRKEIGLEVFTDAKGKVSKVNILKSTGNPEVDKRVVSWAMSKWTGPQSAKAKIPGYVGQ